MLIALYHNDYDKEHLKKIIEKMKILGSPKIKAIWIEAYECWAALEGCHRIRAAKKLGLTPEIIEIKYDAKKTTIDIGMSPEDFGGDVMTMEELIKDTHKAEFLEFNIDI